MDQKNSELWEKILAEIQTEVSTANFLTLFKGTSLISFEDGVATIAAPSSMIIDLLQKRFYEMIQQIFNKYSRSSAKIIFVPRTVVLNSIDTGPLFSTPEKPKSIGHLPRVRRDYTFQTMAVSSSNQLAFVSASRVAEKLGESYNPLFIYGPVGVGKTHLMQAIANKVYEDDPNSKILYITSEEFTNEVVEAIRTNDTARMKRRFRNVSLLLIDDIQFIAGKDRVQEELFHTFNILVDNGAQIVLSSDRPPTEIQKIEKRLLSRFAGGLTVDIETPDFELRCAILLIKTKKFSFDLSMETAKAIAEKTEDTRELEGMLLRIITESTTRNAVPSPELVLQVLGTEDEKSASFHPDEIIKNTCSFYGVKETHLKSPKRDARLVRARQICMYLLKKELDLTFVEIGNLLGGRDHTTIMHGVEKIERMISEKKPKEDILGITQGILRKSLDN
ncbi:MAG: chromosomal replication initiator protein DnaA [Candidatus Levybacteria bacterium]|nr:chromosomal replication initiator protein DnaA [Candidatus Levybacteria bacterium]MBI2420878.1 chromosomal replication initiator protein DnaA [Candidatus Levybacteria bacterium]